MLKYAFKRCMNELIKNGEFPFVLKCFWKLFRKWYPEDNIPSSLATISEVFEECAREEYKGNQEILNNLFTRPKYWVREDGDANVYTIMKRDNWFASMRINGELPLSRQRVALNAMVDALNREDP